MRDRSLEKTSLEVATPQSELLASLEGLGWELQSIRFAGGEYVAKASNPQTGQEIDRSGDSPEIALAAVYNHAIRATEVRQRMAAWQGNWYSQLHQIAKDYADLTPYESGAIDFWKQLAQENKVHAVAIGAQITVEYTNHPQPYESPRDMWEDVHHKGKLEVSTVELEHPVWTDDEVIAFRVCHDVLGICQAGGGWSWPGANRACQHHMPLLSPEAQEALFVEVIGRTAYETVYRGIGPRKVAVMSEYLRPLQEDEGIHVHV